MTDESSATTLGAALTTLLHDEELCDVKLEGTDGVLVCAVRGVLAARSKVFRRMLFGFFAEASKRDVVQVGYSGKTLEAIVEYCVTDEAKMLQESSDPCDKALARTIVSLADAANYFDLPSLKKKSVEYACLCIMKHPALACIFLDESRTSGSPVELIEEYSLRVIRSQPSNVLLDNEALVSISQPVLESILSDKRIQADAYLLFRILKAWAGVDGTEVPSCPEQTHTKPNDLHVAGDGGNRVHGAQQLSQHIRLESIETKKLADDVLPSGLVTREQLFQAFIAKALFPETWGRYAGPMWQRSGLDSLTIPPSSDNMVELLHPSATVKSGMCKWTVKVEKMPSIGGSMWLGVASTSHAIGRVGWDYTSNGHATHVGPRDSLEFWRTDKHVIKSFVESFVEGSVITMTLDLESEGNGTLDAMVDGGPGFRLFSNMLDAFDDTAIRFLPSVTIHPCGGSVRILDFFADATTMGASF